MTIKIEVTDEMVSAGMEVLDRMDGPLLQETLVSEVYRAMSRAANHHTTIVRDALDVLGVALAGHGHRWSNRERELYESAVSGILPRGPAQADS